jgi:hypothetical protein
MGAVAGREKRVVAAAAPRRLFSLVRGRLAGLELGVQTVPDVSVVYEGFDLAESYGRETLVEKLQALKVWPARDRLGQKLDLGLCVAAELHSVFPVHAQHALYGGRDVAAVGFSHGGLYHQVPGVYDLPRHARYRLSAGHFGGELRFRDFLVGEPFELGEEVVV